MVRANKLVVEVNDTKEMTQIKGSVAEKIRNDSTFQGKSPSGRRTANGV